MRRGVAVLFSAMLASGVAGALLVALVAQPKAAEAAFPGINGRIAFSSVRGDADKSSIYTMSFTGNNVRRLTPDPVGGGAPAFSPDGKKIAYVVSSRRGRTNIYVMDADSSNKRLVTDEGKIPGDGKSDFDPAFSPGGRTLVFTRGKGYRAYSLYKINIDGSGFGPVYEGQRLSENPSWSPDGRKIAFNYGPNGIATVHPDGTGFRQVGSGHDPDWSPDGTRLTFVLDEGSGVETEIYTMNADGSQVRQLTHPQRAPDRYIGAGGPVFSPGGGKIAFYDGRDGDGEIFMINADGTDEKKLTQNGVGDFNPAWQPVQ